MGVAKLTAESVQISETTTTAVGKLSLLEAKLAAIWAPPHPEVKVKFPRSRRRRLRMQIVSTEYSMESRAMTWWAEDAKTHRERTRDA